jgi:hypothetical protein
MLSNQRSIFRRNRYTTSGLVAQWDASAAALVTRDGNGYVSSWQDKTQYARTLVQATQGNKPVWQATGISGLGGIAFSGSSQFLTFSDQTLAFLAGTSFTIFHVATKTAQSSNSYIVGGQGVSTRNNLYFGNLSANTYKLGFGNDDQNAVVTNANAGVPECYTLVYSAADNSRRIRRNSQDVGVGASSGSLSSMTGQAVGRYITAYGQFTLGELLIYNRALSATEYLAVERDLISKWSVPTP